MIKYLVLAVILSVLSNINLQSAESEQRCAGSLIGCQIKDYNLLDTKGNSYRLIPGSGRQAIIHFLDHEIEWKYQLFNCFNQAYASLLARNIDFVLISSASLLFLQELVQHYKLRFPVLHDIRQQASLFCEAKRFNGRVQPSTLFLDERGYVHKTVVSLNINDHLAQILLYAFKQPVVLAIEKK
jgi:peroxiredoxin